MILSMKITSILNSDTLQIMDTQSRFQDFLGEKQKAGYQTTKFQKKFEFSIQKMNQTMILVVGLIRV